MGIEQGFLSEVAKDWISVIGLFSTLAIAIVGGILSHQYKKHEWSKERYEILKEVVRTLTIIKAALKKARESNELSLENLNKINRYFDEILPDSEKYVGFKFRSKIGSVKSCIKTYFMCYIRPDVSEKSPDVAWDELVNRIEKTNSFAKNIAGLTFSWNDDEVDIRTVSEALDDIFSLKKKRRET